jgi:hypothetical protein
MEQLVYGVNYGMTNINNQNYTICKMPKLGFEVIEREMTAEEFIAQCTKMQEAIDAAWKIEQDAAKATAKATAQAKLAALGKITA